MRIEASHPAPAGSSRTLCIGWSSANEAALKIAIQYFHNRGEPERDTFLSPPSPIMGILLGSLGGVYGIFSPALQTPVFRLFLLTGSERSGGSNKANANRLAGVVLNVMSGAAGCVCMLLRR